MGLPRGLGVLPACACHLQDQLPETIDGLVCRAVWEHLARPGAHGNPRDAPDVAAKVHAVTEGATLDVARTGRRGRLGGVDAIKGGWVPPLQEEEARPLLRKRVQLLDLPAGGVLEVLETHVLVLHARHGVVRPDHGHVTGTTGIGLPHHTAGKVRALHGRLDHQLLPFLDDRAFPNQKLGIAIDLAGQALYGPLPLGRSCNRPHGSPSRDFSGRNS